MSTPKLRVAEAGWQVLLLIPGISLVHREMPQPQCEQGVHVPPGLNPTRCEFVSSESLRWEWPLPPPAQGGFPLPAAPVPD